VRANSSGSKTAEVQLTGQRAEGTGLYDYGARWYDPMLGRFVQADSVVPSMGDPQAWDRYAYVDNNPVRYVDPTGHMLDQGGGGSSMEDDWWKKRQEKQIAKNYDPFYQTLGYDKYSLWRSVVAGAPCTACHLTINSGRIPGNSELSATQISGWKALDKYAAPIHFAGLGSIVGLAQQAISVADPMNYIPAADAEDVSVAFADMHVGYADENVTAYRYTSPSSNPPGHWLSPDPNLTPDQARATLALPNANTAKQVTKYIIPKTNNYIYGSAAGQTGASWAGPYAVGGGPQIYIPDFSILIEVIR
jgi:RHS repeat-associated protein